MKVIISAGGTGGHIYPALAIINKIKEKEPNSKFLYIGTDNRMEKDLIPSFNIPYESLHVTGIKRKLTLDNFKSLSNFVTAKKKCKKIIKDFNPDVVIGCGGYVTAPVISASYKLGYPTFIHEQNSVVGLANKFLSRYATKIGVSFSSTISSFPKNKAVLTGNPCSESAIKLKKADKTTYGFNKNKDLVIIVMGSLGSKTINDIIYRNLDKFKDKKYEVLFVTGNSYYEQIDHNKEYKNVKIVPYIKELPSVMKVSSLLVSRAGASTISEIEAVGIPTIFIPSPYVTNNHQYKNAADLVENDKALLIEEKDLTIDKLIDTIDSILNDKDKYNKIKNNLISTSIKDSSERIYKILKEILKD